MYNTWKDHACALGKIVGVVIIVTILTLISGYFAEYFEFVSEPNIVEWIMILIGTVSFLILSCYSIWFLYQLYLEVVKDCRKKRLKKEKNIE